MYLKSLQVQGFKSFPDKTTIIFNDGITAIVGPNGSGKSNITDAVRWVLGETSTKTLRGVKMEDVIFDGSDTRSPLGFAEVALTLDNSDKSLPVDYVEVTVSRRYYRSGESEYMINKNVVRLKDIHELLMNTGLGRDGYSIIGQGKIADILAPKSEERRQIFEEAAGISKYRYRKSESERRLEQTDENLTRIGDILKELEDRVGPLALQSETAKEFLQLREEKKGLEVSLWLDNIDNIQSGKSKLENDCATAKANLEQVENSTAATEVEIENIYKQTQEFSAKIELIRNEITSLTEQTQNKDAEIALLKRNIEHNVQLSDRIDIDITDHSAKMRSYDEAISLRQAEIAELNSRITEQNSALNLLIEQSDQITERTGDAESKLDFLNSQVLELGQKLTESTIKIGYSKSSCSVLSENLQRITDQLTESKNEMAELLAEDERLKNEILDTENTITRLKNTIDEYMPRIGTLQIKIEKQAKIKTDLENNINEKNLRLSTLRDMQNHFDGYNNSVKSVMQASEKGQLDGICGPVSSILRTQDKYSIAIETALGNQIQNVVVESDENAKSAVYFLKNNNGGRATFLPISIIKGQVISSDGIDDNLGFVGIAAKMVQCDEKYRNLVNWLLGKICIVYNLENAVMLAKKVNYKYRIVTLDGQVVNAGGSLTGGSAAKGANLLIRQNELTKLGTELESHNKELREVSKTLDDLVGQLCKDNDYIDGIKTEIKQYEDVKTALTIRKEDFSQRIITVSTKIDQFAKLSEKSDTEFNEAKAAMEEQSAVTDSIQQQLTCLNKEISELSGGHIDMIAKRDELVENMSEIRFELITLGKDLESASQALAQLQEYRTERLQLVEEKTKEVESLNNASKIFEQQISEFSNLIVDVKETVEQRHVDIENFISARESAEKSITELRNEIKNSTAVKEHLIREVERLDAKREGVTGEYDNIVMRLFDEYELTLTEAMPLRTVIDNKEKANKRLSEIKNKIKRMGDVNVGAIEEYKIVKERYDFLIAQTNDLLEAKEDIQKVIADLTAQMKSIFGEQFVVINNMFKQTFSELFGGGKAELVLLDPTDVLNSGIEIKVTPPGKVIKNLSALSGGEQAFVAIALYFAIMRIRPTPFCIMDEIETSLDEVNTIKFAEFLKTISNETQVIVITHRRSTMEQAGILYGVTMQEKGVSKLLTINVDEMYDQLQMD